MSRNQQNSLAEASENQKWYFDFTGVGLECPFIFQKSDDDPGKYLGAKALRHLLIHPKSPNQARWQNACRFTSATPLLVTKY